MQGRIQGSLAALAFMAGLGFAAAQSGPGQGTDTRDGFPVLPLPPPIEELYGFPPALPTGRPAYLELLSREAERQGLPAALADAVAQVESGYSPGAVGAVGEIGLMQVLPTTAAMLGYRGGITELFDPEINIRYGVAYLARAWQLTNGDLCRSLMKYRAGHGEERMTPQSVAYCRRARARLAAIGSPLAEAPVPPAEAPPETGPPLPPLPPVRPSLAGPARSVPDASLDKGAPLGAGSPGRTSPVAARAGRAQALRRQAALVRRWHPRTAAVSRAFWAAHEARIKAITARITASRLRIMSGS